MKNISKENYEKALKDVEKAYLTLKDVNFFPINGRLAAKTVMMLRTILESNGKLEQHNRFKAVKVGIKPRGYKKPSPKPVEEELKPMNKATSVGGTTKKRRKRRKKEEPTTVENNQTEPTTTENNE
ncbi:MAG: hypothetical protein GY827_08415 [Cytophagales bacterium]|nr:hypothetical protein [Cytophagales bacterium]